MRYYEYSVNQLEDKATELLIEFDWEFLPLQSQLKERKESNARTKFIEVFIYSSSVKGRAERDY